MKKTFYFIIYLIILSGICGYFFSKMSFIGRLGVKLFYNDYAFLKTWWKGALAVFTVLIILMFLQYILQQKLSKTINTVIQSALVVAGLIGLVYTYYDFQHTYQHRWLKEKFHLGGYLFWIGWISVSLFFMIQKRNTSKMPQQERRIQENV